MLDFYLFLFLFLGYRPYPPVKGPEIGRRPLFVFHGAESGREAQEDISGFQSSAMEGGEISGKAVEEDSANCGFVGGEPLGDEGGQQAGEKVAGSGAGKSGAAGGVNPGATVGVRDHRGGAL